MSNLAGVMYALAVILTFLAVVAVLLRFYARRIKKATIACDDYLIFLALVFTVATGICMVIGIAIGDLGRHTQVTPDGWPVLDHHTEIFLQITYATQLTQTLAFGFTKLAVIFFYKRIFVVNVFAKISWTMIGIVIAWICAFFIANLLQCWPIAANWDFTASEATNCVHTTRMYLGQAWSDVFTDVIILSMPIPCVWNLQMPAKRKIAVSGMFLLGALVVAAGVAKLVVFYGVANDLLTPTVYWPMVESSLGVVGACLPLLCPIFAESSFGSFRSIRRILPISSFHSKRNGFARERGGPAANSSSRNLVRKPTCSLHEYHVCGNSPDNKANEIPIPMGSLSRLGQVPTNRMIVEEFDTDDMV
ncbi:hypothetical protein ABVK25_001028 [Lepraria finkii]|uniref:Rhodopsin domain-containing protein n=1 Tax=Lepraria finkii TaxID=1340010 RepID=A0ABR4BKF6_9LECA